MTKIILTNVDSLDAKNFNLLSNYLSKKGITFEVEQDVVEPISAPKQSKKKPAPKAKDNSDFDREKYLATAKAMGCYGKKGVWKSCRQFVYAVMANEITVEQGTDLVNQLKASKGWA